MVEGPTHTKNDEQFPLLMVAGAGDAALRGAPPAVASLWTTPPCTVTRRPWVDRWPEYLSTCWMTFILIGISFLVFYAIGMVMIYKQQAYIVVKCNDSKPTTEVYYHNVFPRGFFPLAIYSGYLADIATKYPSLSFNVYFLIDDSQQHINFYSKLQTFNSYYPTKLFEDYTIRNRIEVTKFQRKYPNVNITVMNLSKYMAMTPLKYKWRCIPVSHLSFYARIYSVWRYGGVALDLVTANERHSYRRANTILKLHNDGVSQEKYIEALVKLEHEEENEIFSSGFFNMIQRMFNETISIFNKSLSYTFPGEMGTPINENIPRARSVKREIIPVEHKKLENNSTTKASLVNIVLANTTVINATGNSSKENFYKVTSDQANVTANLKMENTSSKTNELGLHLHKPANNSKGDDVLKIIIEPEPSPPIPFLSSLFSNEPPFGPGFPELPSAPNKENNNKSERPQMILFYDFSIVSETVRPESDALQSHVATRNAGFPSNIVAIENEGTLVAATGPQHPFLASILAVECKRYLPKFSINNAFQSQCSGILRDESYCNSIYVF